MLRKIALVAALLGSAPVVLPPAAAAGDLEVAIATADGKKHKGGTLYAADQAIKLEGGAGRVLVRDLPEQVFAIAVDLRVGQGLFKDDLRYVGVAEARPARGAAAQVTVTAQPAADMDAFCSACHPAGGQPLKPGQIVRDIHVSGKELAPINREQVTKFNRDVIAMFRREGKERPPEPVVLEERVVVVNGKETKKVFFTCESCHTVHWRTPWGKYARAAFRERGTLCAGCHI